MEAKIYNKKIWVKETHPEKIKENISNLLRDGGFDVLQFINHHFDPIGYTALWLLGESHLAVHTFPEHNKTYIELSICNKKLHNFFSKNVKKYIK
jgi:S-adenosylmethionine/arginine decarboxylase-like enzyme